MIFLYKPGQLISLFRMTTRIVIRIVTIIRHEGDLVFPAASVLVPHITDYLIYHLGSLRYRPHGETSYTYANTVRLIKCLLGYIIQ